MSVREILQYEIWSKETSRKALVALAILALVLFVGGKVWNEIELHWLTSGERAAAKVALQRIDALQNADSLSDEEFEIRRKEADSAVDAAEKAARTKRDELTQNALTMCYMGAGDARIRAMREQLVREGKLRESPNEWEWIKQGDLQTDTLAHQACLRLHKELD